MAFHNVMISAMTTGSLDGGTQHNNTQICETGIYEAKLLFPTDPNERRGIQRSIPRDRIIASWDLCMTSMYGQDKSS